MNKLTETDLKDYALYELTVTGIDKYTGERTIIRRFVGVLTDVTAAKAMNVISELMEHTSDKNITYSAELIS